MMYPLNLELAAPEARLSVPVAVACRVLNFTTQAFYKWLARPVSDRELENAYLTNRAVDLHRADPEFGYRFICDELRAEGHQVGENRVWRLCSEQGLFSSHARRGGLS